MIGNNITDPSVEFIDTNAKAIYNGIFPSGQYQPTCYTYKQRYSVYSLQGNQQNDRIPLLYIYDHLTNSNYGPFEWGDNSADGDFHSNMTLIVLDSGHVVGFIETDHSVRVAVRKSVNTIDSLDITAYTEISAITDSPAYPTVSIVGTRVYMAYRSLNYRLSIVYSDDDCVTWSTPVIIVQLSNTDRWAYPRQIPDRKKFRVAINYRNQPVSESATSYEKGYYFETIDGINYTNAGETFTKNVVVDGFITETECDTNYTMFNDGASTGGFIGNMWQGSDGTPYFHRNSGVTFFNGTSWETRTITSSEFSTIQPHGQSAAMHDDVKGLTMLFTSGINGTPKRVPIKISSLDNFQTYTIQQIYENDKVVFKPVTPGNFHYEKAPLLLLGQRTYIADGDNEQDPTDGYADFYIKSNP